MRISFVVVGVAVLAVLSWLIWRPHRVPAGLPTPSVPSDPVATPAVQSGDSGPTDIYAHNLMLRKGPTFRVYVRWLRGKLVPTRRAQTPSFDDPESFALDIREGVLRANIGDIANYLNSGGLGNSPLKNVTLWGDGSQINLKGTLHKVIPLPVQVKGELAIEPNIGLRVHVKSIDVLKLPMKWVLSGLHVTVADLVGSLDVPGVRITGNDIVLDTQKLLPPPHIRGQLTAVRIVNPDLEEVFGETEKTLDRVEQWRNFLRLKGGSLDFGKLTMHGVDLAMVDISDDAWFDLDLTQYQKQLVYGYTHMTPQAGLQIFMPDLSRIPKTASTEAISLEWVKNRNAPIPKRVTQR